MQLGHVRTCTIFVTTMGGGGGGTLFLGELWGEKRGGGGEE